MADAHAWVDKVAASQTVQVERAVSRVFQRYFRRSEGFKFLLSSANTPIPGVNGGTRITIMYTASVPAPTESDPDAVDVVRATLVYNIIVFSPFGHVDRKVMTVEVTEMSPALVTALRRNMGEWDPNARLYDFFEAIHRVLQLPREIVELLVKRKPFLAFEHPTLVTEAQK